MPADQVLLLGLDRLDYTKGIIERLRAVERLFEMYPQWIGDVSPSSRLRRQAGSSLDEYQRFESQVRMLAESINRRFGNAAYQPVALLIAASQRRGGPASITARPTSAWSPACMTE